MDGLRSQEYVLLVMNERELLTKVLAVIVIVSYCAFGGRSELERPATTIA